MKTNEPFTLGNLSGIMIGGAAVALGLVFLVWIVLGIFVL